MKKLTLLTLLISAVLLLQNCKKSSTADTTTTSDNTTLTAYINYIYWIPSTIATSITYTAATKTKVLACTATGNDEQLTFTLTEPNATNDSTFNTGTFVLDTTKNASNQINFTFATGDSTTNVYANPTVITKAAMVVSSVDLVNKKIAGTFSFDSHRYTYSNGNITNIFVADLSSGVFNMPYTFIKK